MKKEVVALFIGILLIPLVFAGLDVSSKAINEDFVIDFEEPAVFEVTIRNLGPTETFEIYSLADVEISDLGRFTLGEGQTKTLTLNVVPRKSLRNHIGYLPIRYKVRGSLNNIYEDVITLNLVKLEEGVFEITSGNINPDSKELPITIENKIGRDFPDIDLVLQSAFFDHEASISLGPYESKEIIIPINQDNLKQLSAGPYLLTIQLLTDNKHADFEKVIKFLEQENIDMDDKKEGFLIVREEYSRKNLGNMRKDVKIVAQGGGLITGFVTYNIEPTTVEKDGLKRTYIWEKQLIPNEELNVIVKKNYLYPLLVILLVIIIIFLYIKYIRKNLSISKNVSFVKTRGGEFALKVSLRIKSNKFLERINVVDKLPPLVELYGKFGAIPPNKIDHHNKRLEWNIEKLSKGEERIFTYIIYSKIGVVGRFELPEAHIFYEKEGKIKEILSNRSFYINQPRR